MVFTKKKKKLIPNRVLSNLSQVPVQVKPGDIFPVPSRQRPDGACVIDGIFRSSDRFNDLLAADQNL